MYRSNFHNYLLLIYTYVVIYVLQDGKPIDFTQLNLGGTINKIQDWKNTHPNFTPQLTQSWIDHDFTPQQTQDWINIGLTPQDYNFAHFLKNTKKLTPEEVLNEYNAEDLKQEFLQSQQTPQIQITPFNKID